MGALAEPREYQFRLTDFETVKCSLCAPFGEQLKESGRPFAILFVHEAVAVAGLAFVVELTFLNGRDKLPGYDVFSLLNYDS